MNLAAASRLCFALTMIGIGVIGLLTGGFPPIFGGVPKDMPDRALLGYLCTLVSLVSGAGLLAKRSSRGAALILLVFLSFWTIAFKLPFIIREPLVEVSYQSTGETLVLVAAALVLYAEFARGRLKGDRGRRIARVLFGLALIAFGLSHFFYVSLTAPLVPGWLGAPLFWAYFTGSAYLATGLLLVLGILTRIAATLAALEIALITLLVWGPRLLSGELSAMQAEEAVVSWALTAGALVIAAAFQQAPWFERPRRRTPALVEAAS
ncbi:MAG TPA: DoxX family membrane protein [Sphingomicrobium sp.]|jgi:uncharacterized membrane protein YphA (DoxX/SURF4 family)|nr:DoxX family membrane protein [Sphingomicrobium sp.]